MNVVMRYRAFCNVAQRNLGPLAFDAPALVLPIPEREREVYDITQNEGY